jgi:hypothetical protein
VRDYSNIGSIFDGAHGPWPERSELHCGDPKPLEQAIRPAVITDHFGELQIWGKSRCDGYVAQSSPPEEPTTRRKLVAEVNSATSSRFGMYSMYACMYCTVPDSSSISSSVLFGTSSKRLGAKRSGGAKKSGVVETRAKGDPGGTPATASCR